MLDISSLLAFTKALTSEGHSMLGWDRSPQSIMAFLLSLKRENAVYPSLVNSSVVWPEGLVLRTGLWGKLILLLWVCTSDGLG